MTVWFRFYGYLNDFLPPFRRRLRFRQTLGRHCSVGEALAVVGVPDSHVDVVVEVLGGEERGVPQVCRVLPESMTWAMGG